MTKLGRASGTSSQGGGSHEDADEAALDDRSTLGLDQRIEALLALARLDLEAAAAYEVCAEAAEDEQVAGTLREFAADHTRHVDELQAVVGRLAGGKASLRSAVPAVLGPLARTAALLGLDAAVMTLLANEQLTNRSYETLLELDWEAPVLEALQRNAEDEQRHLAVLSDLEGELWEQIDQLGPAPSDAP